MKVSWREAKYSGVCACGESVAAGSNVVFRNKKVQFCAKCKDSTNINFGASLARMVATLTDEQRAIVFGWRSGYARLIACAGSGKTRITVATAGALVHSGVKPSRILITSFTNKATDELRRRLTTTFGGVGADITCGTFHSLVRGWLINFCLSIGDTQTIQRLQSTIDGSGWKQPSRFNEDEQKFLPRNVYDLAWQLLRHGDLHPYLPDEKGLGIKPWCYNFAETYLEGVKLLQAYIVGPDDDSEIECMCESGPLEEIIKIDAFYKLFSRAVKALSSSTFDEWMYIAAKLCQIYPQFPQHIASQYDYIIVDEAVDNNLAQLTIADALSKHGRGNLLVVGDIRQSIYSFRGAYPTFTIDLSTFVGRPITTWFLTRNFRSTSPIVELGNRIAVGKSWMVGPEAIACRVDANRESITIWQPDTLADEGAEIAAYCKLHYGTQIAVLSRTNAGLAETEIELFRAQVPFVLAKGCGFFGRKVVRQAVCYLRCAFGAPNENAVKAVVPRSLGATFARRVVAAANGNGITTTAAMRMIGGAAHAANIIDEVAAQTNIRSAVKCIGRLLHVTDRGGMDNSDAENIGALADIVSAFANVNELLKYVDYTERERKEEKGAVTLSTVHSAKGLEWDTVIIVQAINGMFPHMLSNGEDEKEEEVRVQYVAVTRAMNQLILSAAVIGRNNKRVSPAPMVVTAANMLGVEL